MIYRNRLLAVTELLKAFLEPSFDIRPITVKDTIGEPQSFGDLLGESIQKGVLPCLKTRGRVYIII